MPEFNKVSYSPPAPIGGWVAEEQLIKNLIQVESERDWSLYVKTEVAGQVIFEYKEEEVVNDNGEVKEIIEGFIL